MEDGVIKRRGVGMGGGIHSQLSGSVLEFGHFKHQEASSVILECL